MGRGWAEEKQIGEELQREDPQTGRWRLEPERVGRQRETGRQSEKRSRLWERGLECRRHLGKEEVLKAGGKEERENGDSVEAGARPPEERAPGEQTKEKRSGISIVRRGWGLRGERLGPGGEHSSF